MEFNNKKNFFKRYIEVAPLALALERTWECQVQSQQDFKGPVLDIGCGEGIFAHVLFEDQIDTGIDPNGVEIDRAKDYSGYKEFIECYGDKIDKPDASFQTIFSNSVMEHIEGIEPVLKESHRLLKDDGRVYLTLPTDKFEEYTWGYTTLNGLGLKGLAKRFTNFFNGFWKHYHCYTAQEWTEMFERNGFEVDESFEYGTRAQCMFNDLASPFSFLSYVSKKCFNRWFFSKATRKPFATVLNALFKGKSELKVQPEGKGGLIFFSLKKKDSVAVAKTQAA